MKTVSAKKMSEIMGNLYDYAGSFEIEMRPDYSGRGMYGKTCVGFVTDEPTKLAMAIAATLALMEREYDEYDKEIDFPYWNELNVAVDNMGLSSILYFSNWAISSDE